MKSNWTKIVGIILATILSLALLFYLGGLVCQIHCNYVQWMSGGGITGDATIAPIKTGILDCWANGVTLTGLKYDLLIIAVAVGIYAFFRLQDRFSSRDRDLATSPAASEAPTEQRAGWENRKCVRYWKWPAQARPGASYWAKTSVDLLSASRKTPGSTSILLCLVPAEQ